MKTDILTLLSLVSDARVQVAIAAIRGIVAAVKKDPARVRDADIDEAIAEALEPWRRIQARADLALRENSQGGDTGD